MIIKSFLIADSPICGNNQVISGTIRYPWKGCKVADELETQNKKVIEDALALAKECGFANIREVKCYYKAVSSKMIRQIIEPFSQKVEKIPERN